MYPISQILQHFLRPVVALGVSILCLQGFAQPVCAINIGPDHTICQGESVTLYGPPGYTDHLWSNGAQTPNITVNAAGNYWVQVTYPSGELVTNGNFDAGNMGFTSQFNYSPLLQVDGNYFIGTNAATYHPQFAGTGNGNFLMVNAGWMHGYWQAWCQTITVCPGQTYALRFRSVSLATNGPPTLQWFVNGDPTNVDHTAPLPQGNWQYFTTMWTAPAWVTSADFCIRVTSGYGVGNDFGLDDISISSTIVLSDDVNVNVTPLPPVNLGADAVLCDGESLLLDAAIPGGSYLWQNGSTAPSLQVDAPGNYSVAVTANNCTATDDIWVSYLPDPQVNLGPDLTLCVGGTVVLDATYPGATYTWQDGSTGPTYTVTGPGTYVVIVDVNGCDVSDAVTVSYNAPPAVSLGPDQTICAGTQAFFDVTTPGATYLWQDGSTGPTYSATTGGTVSVTVTVNGCTATDQANVIMNPVPVVNIGPGQTVCPGSEVVLNATLPGATYLWSTGATTPSITVGPGSYAVHVTVNGCTGSSNVVIGEHTLPVVDLGTDLLLCDGASLTLGTTLPNASYLWNTGATSDMIDVTAAGIYWLDVTQNGCTVRDSVVVNAVPLPVVDLGPAPTICPATTTVLDATTAGGSYSWSTGATTPTITASPGVHSVEVTVNGCSSTASITVGQFPAPTVSLGNDTILCPGQQLVLDVAQGGASYLWQNGSTAPTFTVTEAGSYSVTLIDPNGCTASDQINVDYAVPVAIDLGPDVTLCQGGSAMLDATLPGGSYLWSTGETSPTITVATSGLYSVTVTQGNCNVSDQISVDVIPAPIVDLGNSTTLCPGETLILTVDQPGSTIVWNTGHTGPSIKVDQAGEFSATVTNVAGCSTTGSISVFYASPDALDLGADVTLCSGEVITLDASLPNAAYLWSTGAVSPSITVTSSGIYWVQATQGQCSVSDTVQVTVQPAPSVDLGADITLCEGDAAVLDATWPGAVHTWNTGATTASITVQAAGTYSVVVDLDGCTATDAIEVVVVSPAVIDLGPDLSICAPATVTLDATAVGATHLWSTGANTPVIEVAGSGTYWVQVMQGSCITSDTVSIVVNDPGSIDLGPDITLCEGENVTLDASLPGATYLWNDGNTDPIRTLSADGTYSVTATVGDCAVSDAIVITVQPIPIADLGGDLSICPSEVVEFNVFNAGATYLWQDGSTGSGFSTSSAGTVAVTVAVGGCSATDEIAITVMDGVVVDLGGDAVLCEGGTLQYNVFQEEATYLWDDGSTAPERTIDLPGIYWVNVYRNDCMDSDTVNVQLFSPAMVDLGADIALCPGASAVLTSPVPGATDVWSTGSNAPSITVSQAGTYWLHVDLQGCQAMDSITVTMVEMNTVDLGGDRTICEGDQVEFEVDPGNATILWSTGEDGPSIVVSESGLYSVTLQLDGCIVEDAVQVHVMLPITEIDLGPARRACPDAPITVDASLPLAAEYIWNTGITGAVLIATVPGVYTVEATGHCVDATGSILILEGDCLPVVYVPNAFTPDNDGINDVFRVVVDADLALYRLDIFDRWGALVFTSTDPHAGWDGTSRGGTVQDGVYVWKLDYRISGSNTTISDQQVGHVTLLR